MRILFHLGHPAHFHLFKNVIIKLQKNGFETDILIKEKDVLKNLLEHSGLNYQNVLPEGKSSGKTGLIKDLYRRGSRIISFCRKNKPDVLVGTSADISYVGKFLGITSINVNEDDADVIPFYAWISYPWANVILSPVCCNNGRWDKKSTKYNGYHELAYLHPDHFKSDARVVSKYVDVEKPFFIIRFSSLGAHHDEGVRGVSDQLAKKLINTLKDYGQIFITSEREMNQELEPYRLPVNPIDMHHMLAHAKLVIGDSQTMSAEAGVLGTPYIRYNDFVGKIGYLHELEEKYKLGFGITPDHPDKLISIAEELASDPDTDEIFKERREKMLSEKINVADFLYEYITNFLNSKS